MQFPIKKLSGDAKLSVASCCTYMEERGKCCKPLPLNQKPLNNKLLNFLIGSPQSDRFV